MVNGESAGKYGRRGGADYVGYGGQVRGTGSAGAGRSVLGDGVPRGQAGRYGRIASFNPGAAGLYHNKLKI